jgi:hypothetical protein
MLDERRVTCRYACYNVPESDRLRQSELLLDCDIVHALASLRKPPNTYIFDASVPDILQYRISTDFARLSQT